MRKYTKLPQNAPLEQKLSSYTLNEEDKMRTVTQTVRDGSAKAT